MSLRINWFPIGKKIHDLTVNKCIINMDASPSCCQETDLYVFHPVFILVVELYFCCHLLCVILILILEDTITVGNCFHLLNTSQVSYAVLTKCFYKYHFRSLVIILPRL